MRVLERRNGEVCAESRNFVLSEEQDNAYFHEWVKSNAEEARLLRAYCEKNRKRVVYGEWMGRDKFVGAFKGYSKSAKGTLLIFDVFDEESGEFLPEKQWRSELAEAGLEPYFVKLLAVLDHPTEADALAVAKRNDFLLEGTGMVGKRVVCKVPGWKNKFGHTAYGKIVLAEFKKQRKPAAATEQTAVEDDIVSAFVTDAEIDKTMAKVCATVNADSFDVSNRKMVGMLSPLCWKDLLGECPNWAKSFKNPKADFSVLANACSKRVKEFAEGQ